MFMSEPTAIWMPSPERIATARITAFTNWLRAERGLAFQDYEALWSWSTSEPEAFWSGVWEHFGVIARKPHTRVCSDDEMPQTRWFEGAELNFVDQVFRHRNLQTPALIYESEAGPAGELDWAELERRVAALAHTLRELGVVRGDRVAAYLPNIPQTVIAFLAVASIGAIWSVCAPDLGPVSVVDRFRQIEPKLLIACDGYRFAGRAYDRREPLESILSQLPTVGCVIWVRHLDPGANTPPVVSARRLVDWQRATTGAHQLIVESLPSEHPLWILYSSGTTGLPKAIVHGHGGMIANGMLTAGVHSDVHAGERIFWVSSTSWMVWNAHVFSLMLGATLVLYDGAPMGPGDAADWSFLWRFADRAGASSFGAGAAYFHACLKAGVEPRKVAALVNLRTIGSSGSPLSAEGYHWLYESVKADLWVASISGGTDICGPFVAGLPTLPVNVGEIQCRALGAAVQAYSESGVPVLDQVGELVCERPMPSMPLYFWGDPHQKRYQESYFEMFTGPHGERIWRHGDWLKLSPRKGAVSAVIYGRSDATINRQGVRMGTAELYTSVEAFPEILDSLVVDLEYLGRESYMALFIVLRENSSLTGELDRQIRAAIRQALSPRHVPNEILAVPSIPRTLTGKKLELPIKKLLLGHPLEKVLARDAIADPASLDWFIAFARRRQQLAEQVSTA